MKSLISIEDTIIELHKDYREGSGEVGRGVNRDKWAPPLPTTLQELLEMLRGALSNIDPQQEDVGRNTCLRSLCKAQ